MQEEIRLAALLHDIGKFWQGTGEPHDERYNHLTTEDYGEHGAHSKWSASFVVRYLPVEFQGCERLVLYHHNPKDYELKIISLADWLSSGERRRLSEGEKRGKRMYTPLKSIFSAIDIGKGRPSEYYYPIKKLELKRDVIFPRRIGGVRELRGDYNRLWSEFVGEVERIRTIIDFDAYFNTLYSLLQKYTWCVPSAVWKDVPDVSLFDHLKTTCAIASCLYDVDGKYIDNVISGLEKRYKKEKLSDEEEKALNKHRFLLIGGDISGVQKFIYSITSEGAAKGLRGRSFYLELLSESIAKYVLRELRLPITNLLYCGGGHFYILAPKTAEKDLERMRRVITEKLLEMHRGELYLVLVWLPLSANDFMENFGRAWEDIGKEIFIRKKRKFEEILNSHHILKYDDIFGPFDEGGAKPFCVVCGREIKEGEKCNFCNSLEELAKELSEANYILEIDSKEGKVKGDTWRDLLSEFGFKYEFHSDLKHIGRINGKHISIYKVNDTAFLAPLDVNVSNVSFGFKFIAKETPHVMENKKIKDFDDLANDSEGIKRWAVLRADVDDLGKILSEGLGEDRTISRLSNLSFMLSLFFKGWVERISEGSEYKDKIYVIYSGGDDLFIVGAWDRLPMIGEDIYNDFRDFTCMNPNITLSSGIIIAPSKKYPLYQAADFAGKALEKSKLSGKDRITFLGETMKWEEFCEIIGLMENLKRMLESGVSRGFLHKLSRIYEEYKAQVKKHGELSARYDDRYGRWRWLLAYLIARTRSKDNERLLKEIESLIYKNIEHLPVAVRWVEYMTRE